MVARRVPIVLGGNSDAALRRAAQWGDGWYGFNVGGLDEVRDRIATLHRLCGEAGRDPAALSVAVALTAPDPRERAELAALGVTQVVVVESPPGEAEDAAAGSRISRAAG